MSVRPDLQAESNAALTTGQVARRFKITLQTLHFYESEGLLTPTRSDGRRCYDGRNLAQLAFIMEHRRLGLSLKTIAQLLASSPLLLAIAPAMH